MEDKIELAIVGCGASGGTAAQFAKKIDRKANITIFEKGEFSQYSKCGLPYAISGEIPKVSDLIEFSEEWFKSKNIDLQLNTTIEQININKKVVIAKNQKDKTFEKHFDKLIIASGGQPIIPPIEGISNNDKLVKGTHVVRTIKDINRIIEYVVKGNSATIVGAGLIGLEMADVLKKRGMNVTLIEALPGILMKTVDPDLCDELIERIQKDINLFTNHLVKKIITENDAVSQVLIHDNESNEDKRIDTDLLVVATGCSPNVALAKNIGCKIGETNGIVVNEKSETSVDNVYAVGDCTEYKDYITNKPLSVGLGSICVRQGIAAGVNAAGGEYMLPQGFLQTRTSHFFGMEIAAVGPVSKELNDFSIISGKIKGSSLPNYYPGGKPIIVKLIADKTSGKILGVQAVGNNAAQRINTFACAILNNMTVEEMRKLETAYAPPIAPTLDVETLVCDIVSLKMSRLK